MTPELARALVEVREALERDPNGIVAGELRPGNPAALTKPDARWKVYYELLAVTDGGRFGSIDLWSLGELSDNQYRASDLPGGSSKWLCIGQLLYEPLALARDTAEVRLFREGEESDGGAALGTLDAFVADILLGAGYGRAIPDADPEEWLQFLKRLGRA